MKKNAMLKIAAILMVAVLLTTCAISSTFAKYVSAPASIAATTATTAKWGLTITAPDGPSSIFKNLYGDENKPLVQLANKTLVLAPGTDYEGTEYGIEVEGTPEVAFKVTVDASAIALTDWTISVNEDDEAGIDAINGFYCPVVFTVGDDEVEITDINDDDKVDAVDYQLCLGKAIATAILGSEGLTETASGSNVYYVEYPANSSVFTNGRALTISWEWAFPTGVDAQADAYDTALGNKGAGDMDTITIGYSVSAEQINAFAN